MIRVLAARNNLKLKMPGSQLKEKMFKCLRQGQILMIKTQKCLVVFSVYLFKGSQMSKVH